MPTRNPLAKKLKTNCIVMLLPKKVKFRKWQTGRSNPKAASPDTRGVKLSFGSYGLKSLSQARIKSTQIESARKVIARTLTKAGKYWIRVFPHKPITKKPVGVKMGSGKGDIDEYVAVVKRGTVLFEISGVSEEVARSAMNKASHKLSVDTAFVAKRI